MGVCTSFAPGQGTRPTGPKFFTALQDNTDELERMRTDVDEEYAFEKLRQKAQAVTGMEVHYLYEQEALLAEMQAAKEGVSAHE